jgi:putative spermidine/putrescine transport system ATP-binding protein
VSAYLRLDGLTKRYDDTLAADGVSLDIALGEMIVLLGPSGCGKTTTLRIIAGFVEASSGTILLEGRPIGDLPAHRRDMGMVFQNYALFPHLSVARNVAFGLEMRRMPRAERDARVAEMLRLVKLDHSGSRLPRHLSGGQQQRVAIARALAIHPKVLLLDEPLSNLDAELRQEVAREIRLLQQDRALTTIMVTHDQQEAMTMADRLVVMRDGRVQQVGRQEDLYERPLTPFVARFIGNSNLIAGDLTNGARFRTAGGTDIRLSGSYAGSGKATIGLRPERIGLSAETGGARMQGQVLMSAYMGAVVEHVVMLDAHTQVVTRGPSFGDGATSRFPAGTRVGLTWFGSAECVFDEKDRPMGRVSTIERIESNA